MSTNQTSVITESLIPGYYSLTLLIVGTVFNLLTFLILCRSPFRDVNSRATLHYMRTIAIFDILMLYGWNLDHYSTTVYDFELLTYSIPSCKFITFISYFTPQTSAWLRVFICLDRYLTVTRLNRTCFQRSKTVLIIIICIIITFILLNLHLLIFGCYLNKNGVISAQAATYNIYPLWDYVNLGVYNCAPFILMAIFNSIVIYQILYRRRTTLVRNSRLKYRAITPTLVITTSLFVIMTIPTNVAYSFFSSSNETLLHLLDGMLYTYHVLSFPLYLITFGEFRDECIKMLTCKDRHQQVQPEIKLRTVT
jgi:hypothetical protein